MGRQLAVFLFFYDLLERNVLIDGNQRIPSVWVGCSGDLFINHTLRSKCSFSACFFDSPNVQ